MSKKRKLKNGNNKEKHTRLLNQKKKKISEANLKNKVRLKEIIDQQKNLLQKCPCGTGSTYQMCCYTAHKNIANVKIAEQLMRSRYTGFTMSKIDFLMDSHHSSTRPLHEKDEILKWSKSVVWDKLEVLNSTEDTVEFNAYFYENESYQKLHENSKFKKENRNWMYLEGL